MTRLQLIAPRHCRSPRALGSPYLLARGKGMGERERRHARAKQQAFDDYVRETAGSSAGGGNEADQLAKPSEIRSKGDISEDEFRRAKEKILH
ncbi:hypothetical protein ABTY96_44965 [Streptomyces sp. NPDC096057]|uniref:hypothetical protein n=1 Tax=Streptomyces sp. NPDC096057 TaxID=3155543 RepID=UPI00332D9197